MTLANLTECPPTHPFAYLTGRYCCRSNLVSFLDEAFFILLILENMCSYLTIEKKQDMDGNPLTFDSYHCLDHSWLKCASERYK